jgi:integrase/recombinase XerD
LERAYVEYLARERGVCQATVDNYLHEVRQFLAHRCRTHSLRPSGITAKDLNGFVLRRARRVGPKRAKLTVSALRSFCQFLRFRGDLKNDLSGAVLTVANWRLTSLPRSLAPDEVQHLLRQCDQRTATGQRNFTILLILARLGGGGIRRSWQRFAPRAYASASRRRPGDRHVLALVAATLHDAAPVCPPQGAV